MKLTVEECKYFIFLLFQMANEGTTPFFVVVDGVFVALFSLVRLFVYTTHSSWSVFCLCQMPESNCWSSEWKILEYEIYCCVNICIVWCVAVWCKRRTSNSRNITLQIHSTLSVDSDTIFPCTFREIIGFSLFSVRTTITKNKFSLQFTTVNTQHIKVVYSLVEMKAAHAHSKLIKTDFYTHFTKYYLIHPLRCTSVISSICSSKWKSARIATIAICIQNRWESHTLTQNTMKGTVFACLVTHNMMRDDALIAIHRNF